MQHVRSLLTTGVGKLGEGIHQFSLPAVVTCPGRSSICESVCYANNQGRYRFPQVQERLQWNFEQSLRDDFADRMITEIRKKGCIVIRVHCSGDFYDADYARKWLRVMKECKTAKFYWYSRSWRDPDIAAVLEEMAVLKNCRAWYSIDAQTGLPEVVPKGVALAYLQVEPDEEPELIDLPFVVRRLRKEARRQSLPLLCPHQAGTAENCGHCTRCFR